MSIIKNSRYLWKCLVLTVLSAKVDRYLCNSHCELNFSASSLTMVMRLLIGLTLTVMAINLQYSTG